MATVLVRPASQIVARLGEPSFDELLDPAVVEHLTALTTELRPGRGAPLAGSIIVGFRFGFKSHRYRQAKRPGSQQSQGVRGVFSCLYSPLAHEFRAFTGLTPTRYVEVRRRFPRERPGHVLAAGRCRPID